nr:DUF5683 domain-containing protein [Croceitalea dokdonensis]
MKNRTLLLLLLACCHLALSQETEAPATTAPKEQALDSVQQDLEGKGISFEDISNKSIEINPLAPSKAAFYSAILPGLGQIYNKRYWKAPIVWGAIGIGIATYASNAKSYNDFRDAFKRRRVGFTDDQFFDIGGDGLGPDLSLAALQDAQEAAQRNRDLALVVTIGLYALNVIDANVDAHLKQYNVDDRLGLDIKPYLDFNPIDATPNYGLALLIEF